MLKSSPTYYCVAQKDQLQQNRATLAQSIVSQLEVTTGATAPELDEVAAPSEKSEPIKQHAGIVSDLNTILEERDACGVSCAACISLAPFSSPS
jgi:hypothetical protein